ncbi:MAG: hypothetical protein ACOYT4_01445 [Nanoarchaeota archaeon]
MNEYTYKKIVLFLILTLIFITFLTKYYGSTDIGDYSDTAKYFSGKYSADIRSSHSYLYGYIHSPFLKFFDNFLIFKITSLIFLFLIIYSVYVITGNDKKSFLLILLSPVLWYMAPWINPIQLASLFMLWAYYFIKKFDNEEHWKYLVYSAIFAGLGWAVWDTILFFGFILAVVYLYDKKFYHFVLFSFFVFIGLLPRLLLDQILFNFPFFTILKSTFGTIANISGGIYNRASGHSEKSFLNLLCIFLSIPFYYWIMYKPSLFQNYKKDIVFVSLSLLLILSNPQIRYMLLLVPIMTLIISENLDRNQFKKQLIFSAIILLLFLVPYIIQINFPMEGNLIYGTEFNWMLNNGIHLREKPMGKMISEDLENITSVYKNETFIVGNNPDDFQLLAHLYWGKDVKEFVSIQDYNLFLANKTSFYEKKFMPIPNINERRQIWFAGGMTANVNDSTNYSDVDFAIGINEPANLTNFNVVRKYSILYLSKRN